MPSPAATQAAAREIIFNFNLSVLKADFRKFRPQRRLPLGCLPRG
jgi:hypothetical protein